MSQLLKRIVQAQVPNVLIEDLGYSGVFLRNVGDSRDLLGQYVNGKNKSRFTLEEVCNSRSLDNLIKRGHLKLFDELGNELDNAAGSDAEKSTNLATIKDIEQAVSDAAFEESIEDIVAALIQNGTDISWTYNDGANTLTGNIVSNLDSVTGRGASTTNTITSGTIQPTTDSTYTLGTDALRWSVIYADTIDATIDHLDLINIGDYNHSQIDTHIDSVSNPHSTSDANLLVSDITANNTTTSAHGFAPKLSGVSTQFLDGDGNWTTPAGTANAYYSQSFDNVTEVIVNHNFGAYPVAQILVSDSVYLPFSITHTSINTFVVSFTDPTSGVVIATLGSPQLNNYIVVNDNYTATEDDYIIQVNALQKTITLPTASGIESKIYIIKNRSNGVIFVNTTGGELIDTQLTLTLEPLESVSLYSDGTGYNIY